MSLLSPDDGDKRTGRMAITIGCDDMGNTPPAISGMVERTTFRNSIPARGATGFTPANRAAYVDVTRYRVARTARVIGSH